MSECPFCTLPPAGRWIENATAVALEDRYPISPGHTLVVPRRHVESVFDLAPAEMLDLGALVMEARRRLNEALKPDGFNVGVNDGLGAGQTVMHAHVHVVPRFRGDVPDPRGGVRWVLPEKARYWGAE